MISETKISSKKKEAEIGYIVQVIGPVIDVRFKDGLMPSLKTALVVEFDSSINKKSLILLKIWGTTQFEQLPWAQLKA